MNYWWNIYLFEGSLSIRTHSYVVEKSKGWQSFLCSLHPSFYLLEIYSIYVYVLLPASTKLVCFYPHHTFTHTKTKDKKKALKDFYNVKGFTLTHRYKNIMLSKTLTRYLRSSLDLKEKEVVPGPRKGGIVQNYTPSVPI